MAEFSGVIVMNKPQGFTSFDVVAKMRGICGMKKIGHGGTLDPMATGVLPVFLGKATKAMDLQKNQDKSYEGLIKFGEKTDTGDITGEVLQSCEKLVSVRELEEVLPSFIGKQQQLPPLYSAVKVNGKALYRYAREGKKVERTPREINIYKLGLLEQQDNNLFKISVSVSKGTYIRTLVEDIAQRLGTVATLAALERTKAGIYTLNQALSFEDVQKARNEDALPSLVHPIAEVFEGYPILKIGETEKQRLMNGALLYGINAKPDVYSVWAGEEFLGLAELRQDGTTKVVKLFL